MAGEEANFPGHGHSWQIRVTRVLDPNNFHAQFSQDYLLEHFEVMESELQTYCTDMEHEELGYLERCSTVLAFSSLLDKWVRAEVITVDNEAMEADLVYIDYGHSELRSWDLIVDKFDPKFLALPRMAYLCSLAEVKPLARTWISRAIKYFSDLVLNVTAWADVMMMDDVSPLLTRIFVSVDEKEVSVAELMIAEDLALPVQLHAQSDSDSPALTDRPVLASTNFDSLFKEPPPNKRDQESERPRPAQHTVDPKEHEEVMGDLKLMFGEEMVRKVLSEKKPPPEPENQTNQEDSHLTLEQQIHKMRNRRMTDIGSPRRGSPTGRDVTSPRHRKSRDQNRSPRGQEKVRKVPAHTRHRDTQNKEKQELHGRQKEDKVASIICDLAEIVGSSDTAVVTRSLEHILHCFHFYVLDVNEFLNPEELCNDVKSCLDRCVRYPGLCERLVELIGYMQDHEVFPAAASFAMPRVVDERLKSTSPHQVEPLCRALIRVYTSAISWSERSRLVVHDIVVSTLDKWLRFCLKPDSEPSRVSLYCACLDGVLTDTGVHISSHYGRQMDSLVEMMRELVLSDNVDRSDRETILDLLILEGRGWRDYDPSTALSGVSRQHHQRRQTLGTDASCQTTFTHDTNTSNNNNNVDSASDDVTKTSGDDVTADDEDYVDVRLMLLDLNLSQYLDDMKQCEITDEVIRSADIDLAGLMRDFQIPVDVVKRILLYLGRDLPPWIFTRIMVKDGDASETRDPVEEIARLERPDWSLYRSADTAAPRLEHVSQLGDFMPQFDQGSSSKSLFHEPDVQIVKVYRNEPANDSDDDMHLDDETLFPSLKKDEISAPPPVTRVTPPVQVKTKSEMRMTDLAREIVTSSYSSALRAGQKDSGAQVKDSMDRNWRRGEVSERTADTDDDWRRKSPEKSASRGRGSRRGSHDADDGSKVTAAARMTPTHKPDILNEVPDCQMEKKVENKEEKTEEEEGKERVNLVSLCHDTGALDFKFQDEEEDEEVTTGLNQVAGLFSDPVKNSPVTRGTRSTSRASSVCSKTDPLSPIRQMDWYESAMTKSLTSDNSVSANTAGNGSKKTESRGSTPLCWSDLEAEELGLKSSEHSCQNKGEVLLEGSRGDEGVDADLDSTQDDEDDDDDDDDDFPYDDDNGDRINVIISALEAKQEAETERRRILDKYVKPKQVESSFRGFMMVCTNCGSKEHLCEECPMERKLIFS